MARAYVIFEHDGTSMTASPKIKAVTLDPEVAYVSKANWDTAKTWTSLTVQEIDLIEEALA